MVNVEYVTDGTNGVSITTGGTISGLYEIHWPLWQYPTEHKRKAKANVIYLIITPYNLLAVLLDEYQCDIQNRYIYFLSNLLLLL